MGSRIFVLTNLIHNLHFLIWLVLLKLLIRTMGKKTYFEFLEEEYQALSSQLHTSLSLANIEEHGSISNNSAATMDRQLSRCKAVLQQLRAESRGDTEFKERVHLYKIQLDAMQEHLTQQRS
jgi:hypothetical protein